MADLITIFTDPANLAALVTLVVLKIVLGIDNLIFISIVSNKLPESERPFARNLGIGLALGLRIALLGAIAWLVGLTATVVDLGFAGPPGPHGEASFETAFSLRDLILIAGGLFLVWNATTEIHHNLDPHPASTVFNAERTTMTLSAAIVQIILLNMVFSVDSILTAVGMTDIVPIMVVAVLVSGGVMLAAAGPLARFSQDNPSVVMLALAFLLMIGTVLIADGFGVHVPKGYIYAAMAFSVFVEFLNLIARRRRQRRAASAGQAAH